MNKKRTSLLIGLQFVIPYIFYFLVPFFTFSYFFLAPYIGFDFDHSSSEVIYIFIDLGEDQGVQIGDKIKQVGSIIWEDYQSNWSQELFEDTEPGNIAPLILEREGQVINLNWQIPSINRGEVNYRLISQWWMPYLFLMVGMLAFFLARPRDTRWRLFVLLNLLTATWLAAGSGPSHFHIVGAEPTLHSLIWLSVPIYLHFHWGFPQPLAKMPPFIWWVLYLIFGSLSIGEWLKIIPGNTFAIGLIIAFGGSILFGVLHVIFQPTHRRETTFLAIAFGLALSPPIAVSIAQSSQLVIPSFIMGASLIGMPLLPLSYFYILFRRQFGGLEVRANRLISLYLYFILSASLLILFIPMSLRWLDFSGKEVFIALFAPQITAILTVNFYSRFERFVEYRILGMPHPPADLIQTYATRITTSLEKSTLASLLKQEIMPSLLIRQSSLIILDETRVKDILYNSGITKSQTPQTKDIPKLLDQTSKYLPPHLENKDQKRYSWIRVALPLRIDDKLTGLWLLGSRDPDDFYGQKEISVLQTLADQTAIALENISQAEKLHSLYQTNIDQQELERSRLARELHDDVLGHLAALSMQKGNSSAKDTIEVHQKALTDHLRTIIQGLRPAMLNYGLGLAIQELVDNHRSTPGNSTEIQLDVKSSDSRFDPNVETHLYRILQQTVENAIRHGQAHKVIIYGQIKPKFIHLTIEDDGNGFQTDEKLDLDYLLSNKHYGLVGIHERAALIGGQIKLSSKPGKGTKVNIRWENKAG